MNLKRGDIILDLYDGTILWEGFVKNYDSYINQEIMSMEAVIPQKRILDQILYGRETGIHPTVYIS